jgi:ribonuclease T1
MWRALTVAWTAGLMALLLAFGCTPRSGSVAPPTSPSSNHAAPNAAGPPGGASPAPYRPAAVVHKEPPQRARDVLAEIRRRHGEPPPGYIGGRIFQNRERKLPRGAYREYDVNPKMPGHDRGPERIVLEGRTGKAYYTDDHYQDFVPMP